ncbi:hypothetical protein CHS0354_028426 [Potamilus streckersoni]|uniref:Integrase core domain-containing protein n=1 Tax=Potamilus streckersoni TaxID=2493646 RepID=A0AAE0SGK3_9BIVA|nr:hypothetical protein CHS0354_028426 [Potamilus streckersoni]
MKLASNTEVEDDCIAECIIWHFVIIGGIDGFSRFITFLECTDNNKAETLLNCFLRAVQEFGLPLRVKSDKGMENTKIADYMISARGPNRGSMITGKSTHNQRIEHLWRDVYEGVLSFYYDLFYFMEDEEILDIMNDIHIFALHHVFLSKINEKLHIWRNAWATHRVRTVRSSPIRLYTAGLMNNPIDCPLADAENYGAEGTIDLNAAEDNPRPIFVRQSIVTDERCQQELNLKCPTNWTSSKYGIDIYRAAIRIIKHYST